MKRKRKIVGIVLFLLGIGVLLLVLVLWPGGRDDSGPLKADSEGRFSPANTGLARKEIVTEWYEAVGTVRPRTENRIESQITAQVLDVKVRPGDSVSKDQLLISLDDRQLKSRLDQARQSLKSAVAGKNQAKQAVFAAEAAFKQTESEYHRTKTYFESQAATAQDLERAESAFLQARAQVRRAKEALVATNAGIRQAEEFVKESTIALGYTRITAPETGEVLKRFVEPGDLALPGKPLIALRTTGALRLEAHVREGLISRVKPGAKLNVNIQTLNRTVGADVEEIVPYADPQSRTFLVKASLPQIDGLYPGMFGKLLIPVEQHAAVLMPLTAVRRVGQLELVWVKEDGRWKSFFIKTGKVRGDFVEILSGLSGDETVGWGDRKDE
ncbi:efflux RND transporter periplasmic adaptor subunit [Thermodesulfobacteriota bacterium]